jgi:tetratricopeptide (TPR) repeat protein
MGTSEISRRSWAGLGATGKALNRKGRKGCANVAKKTRNGFPFKAVVIALGILASVAPTAPAQSTTTSVRHHSVEKQDPSASLLTEAEADIDKQDYAGAEPLLKKFLDAQSDSYSGWYDLGYVYHALGRREESIAAYRKSVAAKTEVFESTMNLGLALADAGQPEAEQFLRAATKLRPVSDPAKGHKRAWMALGRFLAASKAEDAVEAFQQAAVLDPKDPEPYLLSGSLLEKQQHSKEAEKEYQQALEIAPNNADALAAMTNLYMAENRFADAEALLRKLLLVHPNHAGAHLQLGRMLAISGNNDEAAMELEAGLKLDPGDAKAQRDLADLYSDSGKHDQAQHLYTSLLASHPNDAGLHYGFGQMLLKQKKFAEAEAELAKAVQLQPDLGAAYGDLAVVANENKDYQLTIKAVELRAKYLPEIPMSYFLRATAYDHLHDSKQAAKYYHLFLGVAGGKYPDQEWQAKHRLIAIEPRR